jgi:hypothetical protein
MPRLAGNKGDLGRMALTSLLVAAALAIGLSHELYIETLINGFFGFAMVSTLVIYLRVAPNWRTVAWVAAGTLSLAFVDYQILHFGWIFAGWLSYLGLTSLVVMAVQSLWTEERERRRLLFSAWVPAALYVTLDYFAPAMLEWTGHAHAKTLDLYLLSFDGSLRLQLAFLVGQFYSRNGWFHIISFIGYVAMAIPIAIVYSGRLVRFRDKAFPSMLAFIITGPVGVICYNLFPACGPRALFGPAFPFHPLAVTDLPRLALEAVPILGARNAIPSLHIAWTLLAWWYSKGLSRVERAIVLAFLVLTVFATLGTGEHWFVDLVVAFPFALMIQAIAAYRVSWKNPTRIAAFAVGLAGTLGWFVALRYATKMFWTSPVVPWALIAGTIAIAVLRQAKLDGVVERGNPSAPDSIGGPASPGSGEVASRVGDPAELVGQMSV